VNTTLVITLAPWLSNDYNLTITQYGYCTIIIGTAQIASILFSYSFRKKLGLGWSILAGILIQFIMFVILLFCNNHGIAYHQHWYSGNYYQFPLLLILLILCIQFIAAEFTYIHIINGMIQIAPSDVSQTVAANCARLMTCIGRIIGAVVGTLIWAKGEFHYVTIIGCICLGVALFICLVLMCCILQQKMNDNSDASVKGKEDIDEQQDLDATSHNSQDTSNKYSINSFNVNNINDENQLDADYIIDEIANYNANNKSLNNQLNVL